MTDTNETPENLTDNTKTRDITPLDGQTDTAETVDLSVTTAAPTAAPAPAPTTPPATSAAVWTGRPPIRWGGVVWGVLLIAFAGTVLFVMSSSDRLLDAASTLESLAVWEAGALWLAVVGGIIAVSAILGGISAAQRRRRRAV